MSAPKIILISQKNLRDQTSGTPRKVHQEIAFFSTLGHAVYVIAEVIDKQAVTQSGGIPIKTYRWPISGYFRRIFHSWQCERWIKRLEPDLVIGHGDIVSQDILYIHNCHHLAHERIHGTPLDESDQLGRLHRKIIESNQFRVVVCNSNMMRDDLHTRFGVPLEKMEVIYPECDLTAFPQDGKESHRHIQRRAHDVEENEVLVGLITSGHFKKRNVDLLLEATKVLSETVSVPFKVIIAGKNKDVHFSKRARSLGIDDRVIFAPSIQAVEQYYCAIDIFVLPAFIEEFGRSVTEAMSCGNPVVVSAFVGSSEILEAESRDFILNDLSVEELAGKLKILIETPEKRVALGKLNQQTVQCVSAQAQNEKLGALLEKRNLLPGR